MFRVQWYRITKEPCGCGLCKLACGLPIHSFCCQIYAEEYSERMLLFLPYSLRGLILHHSTVRENRSEIEFTVRLLPAVVTKPRHVDTVRTFEIFDIL